MAGAGTGVNIAGMRKPYKGTQEIFDVDHLVSKDPFAQFKEWFEEACKTDGIYEANAMTLATCTSNGRPSLRVVLLKGYSNDGFKFYTNYRSRKAKELASNPFASVLFFWERLNRTIRIDGTVTKLSDEESLAYFSSRPRPSQIAAHVSQNQSAVIAGRQSLDERNGQLLKEYEDQTKPVPKPDYWGGYLLKPDVFEFWQGQTNRIHDRLVFRKSEASETLNPRLTTPGDDGWVIERLSP